MAGGKLSPRQKMINMMYLVLTALLALNISKDILESLTKLNDGLVKSVETIEKKNADIYAAFDRAAKDDPKKAGPWRDKAQQVKKQSDDLHKYLADLKHTLIMESGGYADGEEEGSDKAKALDNKEKAANYLLVQGNAEKLKTQLNSFSSSMEKFAESNPSLKTRIAENFNTSDRQLDGHDSPSSWENATFEHYPLAAILPFLTDYQAKVRNTEADVISELQANITASDATFNTVVPVVVPKTNYVTQGGEYEADVFLAAYDDSKAPIFTINGERLTAEQIVDGKGKVKIKADKVGQITWAGVITLEQIGKDAKDYTIPEQTFTVAPPSVVISPTKMNVFYRGVKNPVEIAVPGVDPAKVRVTGGGISGSNGKYFANVDNIKGRKTVKVNVSVEETLPDGTTRLVPQGSKEFRIKGLPLAEGQVYQKSNTILSKGAVNNLTVKAKFVDFPFELEVNVVEFEIAIPGFPPEKVKGNRLTGPIKTKVNKLKPGSTITIRKIQARGPNNLRVRKISNISIDVN